MTKVFFTADCHFGHTNIIKYCGRPFKNINHMNEEIVERWNKKVKPDDLVYHLGDFAYKGQLNARNFEHRLNGNIVHVQGNHDKNNGVKTCITSCIMEFGGKVAYVKHEPPSLWQNGTIESKVIALCDMILCGHVHSLWKYQVISSMGKTIPMINVGVDVWDYAPIDIFTVMKFYNKVVRKIDES